MRPYGLPSWIQDDGPWGHYDIFVHEFGLMNSLGACYIWSGNRSTVSVLLTVVDLWVGSLLVSSIFTISSQALPEFRVK